MRSWRSSAMVMLSPFGPTSARRRRVTIASKALLCSRLMSP